MRLLEVQTREGELQKRAKQLQEELKPESIERSLAGIGSTRPEEIRELRRRQLNMEKANIARQLEQLAVQRLQLESAIVTAEVAAYQQSTQSVPSFLNQMSLVHYLTSPHWLAALLAGFLVVTAGVALFAVIRRL